MQIFTSYKHIKHGYIRTTPTGDLLLSIPRWKRFDNTFKQLLINKGKRLLHKQTKTQALERMNASHVRIWGTLVSKETLPSNIDKYLRSICYDQALIRVDIYSKCLGYSYNMLRIKKLRSKRGSCSSKQNININLDLVYLDKKFLEYVVIHEVCHLQHKHHKKTFWATVEQFSPHYKEIKAALRLLRLN